MENRTIKSFLIVTLLILTILSVSSTDPIDTIMPLSHKNAPFSVIAKKTTHDNLFREESELKYYTEKNLDQVIGACANATWQTAIRLTQDEMAPYMNWTLTKVNVGYNADEGCPFIDVRIYIYDKGTETHPGPLLVGDTALRLNTTDVHTIPLVTPVNLNGHEELWVAVQWTESSVYPYAWIDTLSGPHVPNKSDFVFLGTWQQLHDALPEVDGRWGIGAIVEGTGCAELSISDVQGLIGIKANVSNIGMEPATNVEWSISVFGGLLKLMDKSATGTAATLTTGTSTPIRLGVFIGFGKIGIIITANATNAVEVSVTKSAFLLGPFVLKIRD